MGTKSQAMFFLPPPRPSQHKSVSRVVQIRVRSSAPPWGNTETCLAKSLSSWTFGFSDNISWIASKKSIFWSVLVQAWWVRINFLLNELRIFYFSHGVYSKTTHQPAKQHMDEERSTAGQWSSLSGKLTQLMVLRYNKKQPKTLLLSQVHLDASLLQISQQFSELQRNFEVVRVMPTTRIRGTPIVHYSTQIRLYMHVLAYTDTVSLYLQKLFCLFTDKLLKSV